MGLIEVNPRGAEEQGLHVSTAYGRSCICRSVDHETSARRKGVVLSGAILAHVLDPPPLLTDGRRGVQDPAGLVPRRGQPPRGRPVLQDEWGTCPSSYCPRTPPTASTHTTDQPLSSYRLLLGYARACHIPRVRPESYWSCAAASCRCPSQITHVLSVCDRRPDPQVTARETARTTGRPYTTSDVTSVHHD